MPTHSEAARLNLEYYRKQAKALLKAARSGDAAASQRLPAGPKLHDAQFAIARGNGFPSWPRFQQFITESNLDHAGVVRVFLRAAVQERRRADELLTTHPAIANSGFHAALILGEVRRVENMIQGMPGLVTHPGGPLDAEPLVYVCFSRYAQRGSSRAADLIETARSLLRDGADPNTAWNREDLPGNPLPCLYGATGFNNNPELGLLLLDAGANPNDTESLYHSTEHSDLECVRLLLAHGAKPRGLNALKHMLDREDMVGLRLLLDAGADPNELNPRGETALHWAVLRARSGQAIAALIESGANLDAARTDGLTAYGLAFQSGQVETAALLEARGANTALSDLSRFLGACATAGPDAVGEVLAAHSKIDFSSIGDRLLPDLAQTHQTGSVRALLAAGAPVNAMGGGATALHWACWKGYADLVEVLLEHGASLTIKDDDFHATPGGWFGHGVHNNCEQSGSDYAQAARLLIAAGAEIPKADLPTGREDVDAVLREYGLI
jgi:ankyrin repeat protein